MTAAATHLEPCMGTLFAVDVRDPGDWDGAVAAVVAWLHRVDAVFSTYRPQSDISRIRRGELRAADADPLVAEVLALCAEVERETAGCFSARWDGRLDPTGLVKGWAVQRASELLRARGSQNHAVGGGGDVQLAGEAAPGVPWRVGISDPHDQSRLVAVVAARDAAVATSGTAEHGGHIVDPRTGAPARELAAVTVVGPSLTRADAYATAAVAMGAGALRWLESAPGHEGLVIPAVGTPQATSQFYAAPPAVGGASGSVTMNVAPPPGFGCAAAEPPCASATAATIESPRPTPPLARARDVSTR
jgi:FAD:protein FMN transferase